MKSAVISKILPNGLQVYIIPDPCATTISVKTVVQAGSLYEAPHLGCGLSHFLEHLVAGGKTTHRSEQEYKDLIAKLGGAFNAYTTLDHTCYYINTIPKYEQDAIQILCEWMFLMDFGEDEFKREKDVITKEIEKDKASIIRQFFKTLQEHYYQHHPSRFPVLGYLNSFLSVTLEQLKTYYTTYYTTSNMALIIGGPISPETTLTFIENSFGKITEKMAPMRPIFEEPLPFGRRTYHDTGPTHITYAAYRFPGISLQSPDLYAIDLLDYILGNGRNSLLYKALVDTKLAYSVGTSSYTPHYAGGHFDITIETDATKLSACEKAITTVINQVKNGQITLPQLQQAKKQKLAEDIFSIETVEDKVDRIAQGYASAKDPYFFDTYTDQFKQVTATDLVNAATRYLDKSKRLTVILSPETTKSKKPASPTATSQTIPKVIQHHLANGLRVLCYNNAAQPIALVKLVSLGGIRLETPQNNGIGCLVAHLLGKESAHYSKSKIEDIVEGNGASLSASLGHNTTFLSLECLASDLTTLWPVLVDSYLHPVFSEDEIDKSKHKQKKRIEQRTDEWHTYCSYIFKQKFFNTHPYSLAHLGEKKSVSSLQHADLIDYHNTLLDPTNLIITLFGDIDTEKWIPKIEAAFGHLTAPRTPLAPQTISRPLHTKPANYTLDIPQNVHVVLYSFDGLPFSASRDASLRMEALCAVLSGTNYPSGRLHNGLRDQGLVYLAQGQHHPGIEPGSLQFIALTSTDKSKIVTDFMTAQFEEIKTSLISTIEFEQAMAQLKFYYLDMHARLDNLATICSTDTLYGTGPTRYMEIADALDALTPADIQRAANEYLINAQLFQFKGKPE